MSLDVSDHFQEVRELPAAAATQARQRLARLGADEPSARLDARSGRFVTLLASTPLVPGDANTLRWSDLGTVAPKSGADTDKAVGDAFLGYLNAHQDDLGVDPAELSADYRVTGHGDSQLYQVHVPRTVDGIPVRGSYVTATISQGNVVLLGLNRWGNRVDDSHRPRLSSDEAVFAAEGYLAPLHVTGSWGEPELAYLPAVQGQRPDAMYHYQLAWSVKVEVDGDDGRWEILVDAFTGEVLAFEDTNHYAAPSRVASAVSTQSVPVKGPVTVLAGIDPMKTAPGTQASVNVPADFFCLGSPPVNTTVSMTGVPLVTEPPGALAEADTVIERLADVFVPSLGCGFVEATVRAVNLTNEPGQELSVSCLSGQTTWTVDAWACGDAQPITQLILCDDGSGEACGQTCGIFTGELAIDVCLTFTETTDGTVLGPVMEPVNLSVDTPWCDTNPGNVLEHPDPVDIDTNCDELVDATVPGTSNFFPGASCGGGNGCPPPQCHAGPQHEHCVGQPCCFFNDKGGVYPVSNDGVSPDGVEQACWPMPYAVVGSAITTTGGNYALNGPQTGFLSGTYVDTNDACGAESLTGTGGLDWLTSPGTDCVTPGVGGPGNTHASRTSFYELNKLKEMARGQLPGNGWLQAQLTANLNLNSVCNAFWNGSTVNFFRSGSGCANTGELAAVIVHEWGHGMDANDAAPGISSPSGEGIADVYAALRLNASCIGRNFTGANCGGYGDPCLNCTGIRDIDYLQHLSGQPHTYTWRNANCGGGVHCSGYVYSEAIWSLWKRKLQSPPYNMDNNTSWEVVNRLTFLGGGNTSTWFSGGPPNGGCAAGSGYMSFLAADDDDANLANGTPHMQAIFDAFNDQEIACPTPTVQDSGCAGLPTVQPNVTGTPGIYSVRLDWNAVPGATAYQVFRTEGVFACDFGKVKLGQTTGLTWNDNTGLQEGRPYSYVVIPIRGHDTCKGPASDCDTVIPLGWWGDECQSDADCDDGLFCNGAETCNAGACEPGVPPCPEGTVCDEVNDLCVSPCSPRGTKCSRNADCCSKLCLLEQQEPQQQTEGGADAVPAPVGVCQ